MSVGIQLFLFFVLLAFVLYLHLTDATASNKVIKLICTVALLAWIMSMNFDILNGHERVLKETMLRVEKLEGGREMADWFKENPVGRLSQYLFEKKKQS